MVINDNHLVELTFSMSWMNRLCSRWLKTLDEIMSWLSSSQEKIIMCWWYRRRAWSKGCIMCWCVSSSRRGDDHELIIKSKRRSIMCWWKGKWRMHHVLMHIKTQDEGCHHVLIIIKSWSRSKGNHHVLMIFKSRTRTWSEDVRHQASRDVQGKCMTS